MGLSVVLFPRPDFLLYALESIARNKQGDPGIIPHEVDAQASARTADKVNSSRKPLAVDDLKLLSEGHEREIGFIYIV